MNLTEAVIKSGKTFFPFKIFGQYLIERNIRILNRIGVKKIYLTLSKEETLFYKKNIEKHVQSLKGTSILFTKPKTKKHYLLSSNFFLFLKTFANAKNFTIKDSIASPKKTLETFEIQTKSDLKDASAIASEIIRKTSGGIVAQNVNKRISIPLSRVLAFFRVHPNTITIINFFLGLFSLYLIVTQGLLWQAFGGFLFQCCSIFDGCDGEVARMTNRFSKLGGILDTVSDQTLALLLIATGLFSAYKAFSFTTFLILLAMFIVGILLFFSLILFWMTHYSQSMSFASLSREFIEKLPQTDKLALATKYLQYLTRKEIYSLCVFVVCALGILHIYTFAVSCFVFLGGIIILILAIRYFSTFKRLR